MAGRLVLTMGEPAGIGPDLCVQMASYPEAEFLAVAGDPDLLESRAALLGRSIPMVRMEPPDWPERPEGGLRVWPLASVKSGLPGCLVPENADFVLTLIERSVDACLHSFFDGLVTGPVSKASISASGRPFSGHTEFIAELTGGDPVMLLEAPGIRVALATTHLPLREVPDAIEAVGLERTLRILHSDLRGRFGISHPRILVAGLNPHAGESGHLGDEEIRVILPVVERLRSDGLDIEGPLPADTLFVPRRLETADAVLAMYHDQGLPVLKHRGFGCSVNITLGLPIIRTSVDHGVALDLAGTGQADPGSLLAAVRSALRLVASVNQQGTRRHV